MQFSYLKRCCGGYFLVTCCCAVR